MSVGRRRLCGAQDTQEEETCGPAPLGTGDFLAAGGGAGKLCQARVCPSPPEGEMEPTCHLLILRRDVRKGPSVGGGGEKAFGPEMEGKRHSHILGQESSQLALREDPRDMQRNECDPLRVICDESGL